MKMTETKIEKTTTMRLLMIFLTMFCVIELKAEASDFEKFISSFPNELSHFTEFNNISLGKYGYLNSEPLPKSLVYLTGRELNPLEGDMYPIARLTKENLIFTLIHIPCGAGGICENTYLYTFEKNGNLINSFRYQYHMADLGHDNNGESRFINDSIIQFRVYNGKFAEKEVDGVIVGMDTLSEKTTYAVYQITSSGKISKLSLQKSSNRKFNQTSYRVFDLDELKLISKESLAIMRNEIFADYGYIFKTDKWKDYFSQKSWYEPRFENVNDKLNAVELENIKLIRKVESLR